jgi:hypothetical protein
MSVWIEGPRDIVRIPIPAKKLANFGQLPAKSEYLKEHSKDVRPKLTSTLGSYTRTAEPCQELSEHSKIR